MEHGAFGYIETTRMNTDFKKISREYQRKSAFIRVAVGSAFH